MTVKRRATFVLIIFFFFILAKPLLVFAVILDLPFKSQVPPGIWDETRNCGQTSYLMIDAFFNNKILSEQSIKDLDEWIEQIFGDSKRDYSGNYTNVDMLKRVALEYGDFSEEEIIIDRNGDIDVLIENLEEGNPIIIAVYTNMMLKGERKDRLHFMVLTGIDDTYVYVNDPGKTLGKNNQYTIEQFKIAWAKNNYASIIFKKNDMVAEEPPSTPTTTSPVQTETHTSVFQSVLNFFKNIFHNDTVENQSQAQQAASVETNSLEEEQSDAPKEEDPVYDAVFLPASVTVDVFPQDDVVMIPIKIQNTGNTTWAPHTVSLNVVGGVEQNSEWYTNAWKTKLRPVVIDASVEPGKSLSVLVPVTRPTDVSKVFRLQLVRQQGTNFFQLGSGFATVSFHEVEKEEPIPEIPIAEERPPIIDETSLIEKIKDVSNVLGDKIVDTTKKVINTIVPFFYSGGGGGNDNASVPNTDTEVVEEEMILPNMMLDDTLSHTFATSSTTITLFGIKNDVTTDSISSISSTTFSFTTTTWKALIPLVEGENEITLTPVADSGIQGTATTLFVTRDTTAPQITLFDLSKNASSTYIAISWLGDDNTSSTLFYTLQVQTDDASWTDVVMSTTSISYVFSGERPHEYIFRVQASDELENTSEWQESDEGVSFDWSKSVSINEVAWGGSGATPTQTRDCPKQEWIELKNTTGNAIDLSGWHITLLSQSGATSSLALAGTIEPGAYYLLTRKDRGYTALAGLSIDLVYENVELDNSGMHVLLVDANGEIIDELSFLFGWPAGNPGRSMERMGTGAVWKTTEHISPVGQSNGCTSPLYGSPLQPNDRLWRLDTPFQNYPQLLDEQGVLTLTADHSPYVFGAGVVIPPEKTLVVDPGVTLIGLSSDATLIVQGTLITNGTAESPVKITSSHIASDSSWHNQFFGSGNPSSGDWSHIDVASGGTMEMHHTEVSYGGNPFVTSNGFVYGKAQSQVIRNSGTTILDHVSLLYSYIHTNHNFIDYNAVLWMQGGSVTITDSVFDTGGIAIKNTANTGGSVSIADTRFSNFGYPADISYAPNGFIILYGIFPHLSGNNIFSENKKNNIVIFSYEFTEDTTISAGAQLSFGSITIPENITLTVEEGAHIGIGDRSLFDIYGTLKTNGTASSPVFIEGWGAQWGRMTFYPGSVGNLSYTNIHGGGATINTKSVMVDVSGADVVFDHTNIKYGRWPGTLIRLRNSDTSFVSCNIGYDAIPTGIPLSWVTTGIDVQGGTTLLDDVFITYLKYGIQGNSGTIVTAKNMDVSHFENIVYNNWLPVDLVQFALDEDPVITSTTLETSE